MKKYYIYTYFRIGHSWVNLQLRVEVRGTCTATCQATWLVEVPAGDLWAAAPSGTVLAKRVAQRPPPVPPTPGVINKL